MSAPVHLALPGPEPVPVVGCGVCSALNEERREARRASDMSKVTDINIELRNHPHDKRQRA